MLSMSPSPVHSSPETLGQDFDKIDGARVDIIVREFDEQSGKTVWHAHDEQGVNVESANGDIGDSEVREEIDEVDVQEVEYIS